MPNHDASRRMATVFARRTQLAGLLLLGCVSLAMAADKVAELNDDFLEYLGSLEGDDESWLDFTAATTRGEPVTKPQVAAAQDSIKQSKGAARASSSSASSLASQPATHAAGVNTSATPKSGKADK